MDFITNQIFDLGHFGYAYDALSELILQEPIDNREERTQTSLALKEVLVMYITLNKWLAI